MATSWTMTAGKMCRDALEHLRVIGAEEAIPAADMVKALGALDGLLKELPLYGYSWPQLSGEVALAWAGTTASLPADYFGMAVVRKTVNGQDKPLIQIPHADWVSMTDRAQTAPEPTHFYIDPANVLHYWPVPTQDPVAKLQYQKIIPDAAVATAPNLPQYALMAIPWGMADEMSFDYGLQPADRVEINTRWMAKRAMLLEMAVDPAPVEFGVAD